jgi:prevent-host-death family protein
MAAHPKSYPVLEPQPEASVAKGPRIVVRKTATKRSVPREPIAAAKAKAHLLQLLDEVQRDREPITITKRGRIVAQLIPADAPPKKSALEEMFGRTAGMMTITGDIVSPNWDEWGPEWR